MASANATVNQPKNYAALIVANVLNQEGHAILEVIQDFHVLIINKIKKKINKCQCLIRNVYIS